MQNGLLTLYLKNLKKTLPCAAHLDGEYGIKNLYVGVPVVIGNKGVERIIELKLNSTEKKQFNNSIDAAKYIIDKGITLVLLEQTNKSKSIYEIDWSFPICFIVGNEVKGVSEELSSLAHIHAEIPMRGVKQSLNVSVATGIAGYEFSKVYSSLRK